MKATTLDKPVDLQLDARVDKMVEVAARVLEREGVWVDELLADE